MPITMRNIFFWSAASGVFACLLFFGIDFGIYEPAHLSVGISPRAYPRAIVLAMLGAALYLVLENCLHHKRAQAEEPDAGGMGESLSKKKLLLACLFIAGYCLSVPYLGLAPASALAFMLLTRLNGERNMFRMLCIGGALATGLYYFFLYAAAVPMPTGPFGGII